MTNRIGQKLGNYHLVRLLGEGGFAEVYLGEHIHLGTKAAIKVQNTKLTKDDVEMFRNEARTVANLVHPHIVRVLDFGMEDNVPYLVMDYASNGSLRQIYPRGTRLPLSTVTSYVKQVAEALQYAHERKLIHRDIKPENMLLGQDNEVLLSDFGIATIAHNTSSFIIEGVAGTIPYMAPEQIQQHPRPASDQYSLGIVVYEWLCGERPFQGSAIEIGVKHSTALPPSLREKSSTISQQVEQVVFKALAKDPKERFEKVIDFATNLEQAIQLMNPQPRVILGVSTNANPSQPQQPVVLPPPHQQAPYPPQGQGYVQPSPPPYAAGGYNQQVSGQVEGPPQLPKSDTRRGQNTSLVIGLVTAAVLVLMMVGGLLYVQGQGNNPSTGLTPTPGVTPTPGTTPSPSPTSVPFQVTTINLSVNPLTIGKSCGTQLTVTYTATFNVLPRGPGGALQFEYTTDGGRNVKSGVVQFSPGQTSMQYQFPASGTLELNGAFPGAGQVTTTSPNIITSQAVTSAGACTP